MAEAAPANDILQGNGTFIYYGMDPYNIRPKGMSIAIGNNAKIHLDAGTEDALLSFGYEAVKGKDDDRFGYTIADNTEAKENLPEGIAIGTNSFARTGSIEIGAHNLGADVEIGDTKGSDFSTYGFRPAAGRQLGVASTTVGTNSYANGMFTTTYGSYNVQSSQYLELHEIDTIFNGYKNAFGTVVGSLNSNESITAFPHSGAENSIIGTGNRVNNSSGSIAIGTGNEVKNTWGATAVTNILSKPLESPKAMQDAIIAGTKENPGGAVMAIGNGNKVDSVSFAQILGTGNELKGKVDFFSGDKYVMIDGYNNSFTRANNTTVIGTANKGSYVTKTIVMGDNANVENVTGDVMIGDTNSASYVNSSLVAGAKNTITGTSGTPSASNILAGVGNTASAVQHVSAIGSGNTATNVQHASAIGSGNIVTNASAAQVFGDDNKNSYTNTSLVTGVKNTLSGTEETTSTYNIVSGAENTATSVQHVSAIGSGNTVNTTLSTQILGDTNSVSLTNLSQVIGNNNKVSGSAEKQSAFNLIAGGTNTASNVLYTTVLGTINTASNTSMSQVSGYSNRVTNADFSQVSGANNILLGLATKQSANNVLNGYKNTAVNIQHVSAIGSLNTVYNSTATQLIGDNRYLSGADRSVVIGSADSNEVHMTSDDIVAVGYNSYATVAGGAAFGSESVANTVAGYAGYDPLTNLVSMNTTPTWKATRSAVSVGDAANGITRQITGVAAGTQDTDAVNVAQLKKVVFAQQNANQTEIKAGNGIQVIKTADGVYTISANITGSASTTGQTTTSVGTAAAASTSESTEGTGSGTASPVSRMALTTSSTSAAGTRNTNSRNFGTTVLPTTPDNEAGVQNGDVIVIQNETEATNFTADDGNTAAVSPNGTLSILGDSKNTTTTVSGTTLSVAPKDDISVTSVTTGNTKIDTTGVTIQNGPSMTSTGIDAGSKVVKNVANGEVSESSTDAVNGSQLYAVKNDISNQGNHLTQIDNRIGKLDSRINKAGANAAALAALHPLDFDPDDKWNFAAGVGHYHDANAAAVGAFYRPNEDVMLSIGAGFGNGENMLNAGISFHVGQGKNSYPTSRKAMAKTIDNLNKTVAAQNEKIEKLEAMLEKQQAMIDKMAEKIGQ